MKELLKVCEAPVIRGCTWPAWHIRRERGRGWFAEGTRKIWLVPAINRKGCYDGAMVGGAPTGGGVGVDVCGGKDRAVIENVIYATHRPISLVMCGFPRGAKRVMWGQQR